LPGLIDAHTHISGPRYTQPNDSKSPIQLLVKCCQVAQRHLDYGYTTIRDAGSLACVDNFVRAAVEEGVCVGPRIIANGLIINPTELVVKLTLA
jgi:imidazolonepropionase-like amidohydrolase